MENVIKFAVWVVRSGITVGLWSFLGGLFGSLTMWTLNHKGVRKHTDEIVVMLAEHYLVEGKSRLREYLRNKKEVREIKKTIKKEKREIKQKNKVKKLEIKFNRENKNE